MSLSVIFFSQEKDETRDKKTNKPTDRTSFLETEHTMKNFKERQNLLLFSSDYVHSNDSSFFFFFGVHGSGMLCLIQWLLLLLVHNEADLA